MKTIAIRELQKQVKACVDAAQTEAVIVTRHGKPAAVFLGVEGYDWETVLQATNPEFWRLIEARRKQPTISLEEAKAQLREGAKEEKRRGQRASPRSRKPVPVSGSHE
jgi:prevent-host-death family protein